MNRLLLIDGLGCLFTHHHAKEASVEYSFLKNLSVILKTYKPTKVLFLREGGSTYRKELLPEYKAARKERRDAYSAADQAAYKKFLESANTVAKLLPMIGIGTIQHVGAEADDLAGLLCAVSPPDEWQILLLSEDSDWNQLLYRKNTVQGSYRAMCKSIGSLDSSFWKSASAFERENGYTISQGFEAKLLCGDSSDSIPGIEGLGATGALNLIKDYGCLKEVLHNRGNITTKRITTKAKEGLLTCDPILDRGYKLMNLRWSALEWSEILQLSVDTVTQWLQPPEVDYKAFEELCYEYGWLGLLEENFLDPCRRLTNA